LLDVVVWNGVQIGLQCLGWFWDLFVVGLKYSFASAEQDYAKSM
jgi:hypothetical protein